MPFISAAIAFITANFVNIVVAVGLSLVQKMLQPKRKKQDTDSLDASQQVQRQLSYAVPREVLVGERITGGVGAFNDAYGTKNEYGVSVTILSAKPCNAFVGLYLTGDLMSLSGDPTVAEVNVTSHFKGKDDALRVRCRVFLGDNNAALGAYLNTKFPSEFSATDNFNDMCVAVLECRSTNDDIDEDTGESYIPFQGFPKAKWRMQGAKVCDPRIALSVHDDESTHVYSDNPELIAAQADYGWYTGDTGKEKLVVGNGYPVALLDLARIADNADFCDIKGYSCAGRIRATAAGDLEEIRKCYNAIRVESPSQVYNIPEANRDAAVVIDMSLYPAARVTNANRQGYSSDVYNSARTFYQEPAEQYGKRDLPIFFDQALIDEDGGVIRELELPLNFVTDGEQAANLEKEEMAISRAAGTAIISDLPAPYGSNRILKVGGLVTITNSRMAWMNGMTFCVQGRSRSPDYDVSLTLQAYAGDVALAKIAAVDLPDLTPAPMPTTTWVPTIVPYVPATVITNITGAVDVANDTQTNIDNLRDGTDGFTELNIDGRGNVASELDTIDSNITELSGTVGAGETFTLSKNPVVAFGAGSGDVTTGAMTITALGGVGALTYVTSKVSGDTFTINNGTTNAPSFTANVSGGEKEAIYKTVVTDSDSPPVSKEIQYSVVAHGT